MVGLTPNPGYGLTQRARHVPTQHSALRTQHSQGGALLVAQSGGCTAVMNASLVGVLEEAARQPGVGRVYGALHGVLGLLDGETVELDAGDAALRRRLAPVPAAALGSCRHQLRGDEVERALATLQRLDVRY